MFIFLVVLHGGSNGFQWTALQLPNGPAPPVQNVAFATTTGEKNYLELPLSVGDVVTGEFEVLRSSHLFNPLEM